MRIPWNKGFKMSTETCKKISLVQLGKKHSEETKKKMSESHKKLIRTQEHKDNLSKSLKGRKFTEEWKKKISNAHKGKIITPKWKAKIIKNLKNGTREFHGNWKGGLATDDINEYKRLSYKKMDSNWIYNQRKKSLSKELIKLVYKENIKNHGYLICYYCNDYMPDNHCIEHKVPLSRGGSNDYENLVVSCKSCNLKKGKKTENEFLSVSS